MASRLAELIDEIDLRLAQRLLGPRPEGAELLSLRESRDRRWIQGALGCFGQSASDADIANAVGGRAGRFLPGEPMHRLVTGMRREIDRIDAAAERGARPGLAELRAASGALGWEFGLEAARFDGCFGARVAGEHPLRVAVAFARELASVLGPGAPSCVLVQLLVAQQLLAQGYPAPGWDDAPWAAWQLEAGALRFAESVRAGLGFCP